MSQNRPGPRSRHLPTCEPTPRHSSQCCDSLQPSAEVPHNMQEPASTEQRMQQDSTRTAGPLCARILVARHVVEVVVQVQDGLGFATCCATMCAREERSPDPARQRHHTVKTCAKQTRHSRHRSIKRKCCNCSCSGYALQPSATRMRLPGTKLTARSVANPQDCKIGLLPDRSALAGA